MKVLGRIPFLSIFRKFSTQIIFMPKTLHTRPLTEAERERIQALPALIQTLKTQLDELDKELRYLERIEETEIKVRYSFGKPPAFSDGGTAEIINLGEFPMKMENPTKIPAEQ